MYSCSNGTFIFDNENARVKALQQMIFRSAFDRLTDPAFVQQFLSPDYNLIKPLSEITTDTEDVLTWSGKRLCFEQFWLAE